MKTLVFKRAHNLDLLGEELLAAFPQWAGELFDHPTLGRIRRNPLLAVSGDGTDLTLIVPDDADELAVAAVVLAHDAAGETASLQSDRLMKLRRQQAKEAYRTLAAIRGMTPDQAQAWVQANVTTVATARAVMGQMAYALAALVRYLDIED